MRQFNRLPIREWEPPIPEDVTHNINTAIPAGVPLKAQKLLDLRVPEAQDRRQPSSEHSRRVAADQSRSPSEMSSSWSLFRSRKGLAIDTKQVGENSAASSKASRRLSTMSPAASPAIPSPSLSRRESTTTLRGKLFRSFGSRTDSTEDSRSLHRNITSSSSMRSNGTSVIMGQDRPLQVPQVYLGDTTTESVTSFTSQERSVQASMMPPPKKPEKKSNFFRRQSKIPVSDLTNLAQYPHQPYQRKDLESVSRASLFSRSSTDTARTETHPRPSTQQQQQPRRIPANDIEETSRPSQSQDAAQSGLRNWFDNVDVDSDEEPSSALVVSAAAPVPGSKAHRILTTPPPVSHQSQQSQQSQSEQQSSPAHKGVFNSLFGWMNQPNPPEIMDSTTNGYGQGKQQQFVSSNQTTSLAATSRNTLDQGRSVAQELHQPTPSTENNEDASSKKAKHASAIYIGKGPVQAQNAVTAKTQTDYLTSRESVLSDSHGQRSPPVESPIDGTSQTRVRAKTLDVPGNAAHMIAVTQEEMAILNMIRQQRMPAQTRESVPDDQLARRREAMIAKAARKQKDKDSLSQPAPVATSQPVQAPVQYQQQYPARKAKISAMEGTTYQKRSDTPTNLTSKEASSSSDTVGEQGRLTRPNIRSRASSLKAMQTGQTYNSALSSDGKSASRTDKSLHKHSVSNSSNKTAQTISSQSINSQPPRQSNEMSRRSQFAPVPMLSSGAIPASPGPPPSGPIPAIPQQQPHHTAIMAQERTRPSTEGKQPPTAPAIEPIIKEASKRESRVEVGMLPPIVNSSPIDLSDLKKKDAPLPKPAVVRGSAPLEIDSDSESDLSVEGAAEPRQAPRYVPAAEPKPEPVAVPQSPAPSTRTTQSTRDKIAFFNRANSAASVNTLSTVKSSGGSIKNRPASIRSFQMTSKQPSGKQSASVGQVQPTVKANNPDSEELFTALPQMAREKPAKSKKSRFSIIKEADSSDEVIGAWTELGGNKTSVKGY